MFIIQIVLLIALTNDLSHYLSRASTTKAISYEEGNVFHGSEKGIAIEKSQGFIKKNILILLNILNQKFGLDSTKEIFKLSNENLVDYATKISTVGNNV